AQERVDLAQGEQFAVHDVGWIVREYECRIIRRAIKPAPALRGPEKIRIGREQPRHRMIKAAHQGAVDEETIGGHGSAVIARSEATRQSRVAGVAMTAY